MRRLALLLAASALLLGACSSDSGDDAATGDTTTTAATGSETNTDTGDLPSFTSVAEVGTALGCELEYDGIIDADREYSTCIFNEEQALIYIYTDPAFVGEVVATSPPAMAYGANWTIELETPDAAQAAADATGGAVA